MTNDNKITLPVFETAVRSFMYVIKNFSTFAKICSIFTLLLIAEIVMDLPSLCYVNNNYCRDDLSANILAFVISLGAAIVAVETIRNIILRQEYKWFSISFGMPHLKYIGYSLLITAMIAIPSVMILTISSASSYTNISPYVSMFLNAAFITTLIGLSVFCFRLYLVYAGAAVGDKEMTLYKSYALTTGNMLRILAGQVLVALPSAIFVLIIIAFYQITEWGFIANCIFVFLGIFCSYFDIAVRASYHSHIYQYFIYYDKQKEL